MCNDRRQKERLTLTVDETAKRLGIGRSQTYAGIRNGQNPRHQDRQALSGACRLLSSGCLVSVRPPNSKTPLPGPARGFECL